jgi:AraC-like DNA-binding protein
MPVSRQLLATDGPAHLERVRAAAHGPAWGPEHIAQGWRCVLPGQGQVDWRNAREQVFVDPLTAFRLDAGESYQLRHEREREHLVLCSTASHVAAGAARAWLLRPGDLLDLRTALARVRRGALDLSTAAAVARGVLDRSRPIEPGAPPASLLRARRCLASRIGQRLLLEEVAEEAKCSPFHLSRLFRRYVGASPHQYQLHLRVATAIERLEDAGTSIADLAFDLGFSSQSHFGDVLRRMLGATPAEVRAALR